MARRLFLVTYDISNPKRWRKVFRMMHGYGEWLQLSVFRCRLTPARRDKLAGELARLIAPEEDRVLIADLGNLPRASVAIEAMGRDLPAPNEGPWIV